MTFNRELVGGLRLERMEVYNWGTFNGRVWQLLPQGGTALMTGANGSGKSTLVDALLTLLVAPGRRNYNQASGSEKRRERDEKTYVRGAWGKKKEEEHDSASSLGEMSILRKQLRAVGADVYDEFSKYSKQFRRLAYLRSEKACDLFNQIVSIKDIESLNAFVRNHMLEKIDTRGPIEQLRGTFANLNQAYAAIQLAEQQLVGQLAIE